MTSCNAVLSSMLVLLCSMQLTSNQEIQFGGSSDCQTPNQRPGLCRNIKQCPDLLNILRSQRQDSQAVAYLRNSVCGYDGFDPQVCCPSNRGGSQLVQPDTTTTSTRRPVVQPNREPIRLPVPDQCGFSNASHNRVVDGKPAAVGAWPWLAALGYKPKPTSTTPGPKFLCGATLITDRHVITAGHCVFKREDLYLVRLGEHDLKSDSDGASPLDVPISKRQVHEDYSPTQFTNDIALIWLAQPLRLTFQIRPICLPFTPGVRNSDFVRTAPFIAGWGAIYFNGPSSSVLLEAQIPVVENQKCKKAFENFKTTVIDDRVLCAGYAKGGKDACQGDSGGPLMLPRGSTFYLIGVVSYGFRCAEPGYPGVYTRVTHFLDWIQQNLD